MHAYGGAPHAAACSHGQACYMPLGTAGFSHKYPNNGNGNKTLKGKQAQPWSWSSVAGYISAPLTNCA